MARLSDLSPRSWWWAVKRTVHEFQDDELGHWAAALTYYSVLSLFPALVVLVAIVGLVIEPKTLTNALTDIAGELGPKSAVDAFAGPIRQLSENKATSATLLPVGVVAALWSASSYVGAFFSAANKIYEVEEGRSFWKRRPLQLALTLGMVLTLALLLLALVLTGPVARGVGRALGVGDAAVHAWQIAKWPVMALVALGMLAVLYYLAPNARLPRFRWVTPGSLLALAVWALASAGFAFYVANFGSYDKTYGTLGGAATFLVWAWLTNQAVLLGAELNAELERARQIAAGTPGAEEEIQLPPRDPPGRTTAG
jgi:membrane protein